MVNNLFDLLFNKLSPLHKLIPMQINLFPSQLSMFIVIQRIFYCEISAHIDN